MMRQFDDWTMTKDDENAEFIFTYKDGTIWFKFSYDRVKGKDITKIMKHIQFLIERAEKKRLSEMSAIYADQVMREMARLDDQEV